MTKPPPFSKIDKPIYAVFSLWLVDRVVMHTNKEKTFAYLLWTRAKKNTKKHTKSKKGGKGINLFEVSFFFNCSTGLQLTNGDRYSYYFQKAALW